MKTNTHRSLNALILAAVSLFLISPPMTLNAQARRVAGTAFVQSAREPARIIIHRVANLGRYVIVDFRVDGVAAASLAYGNTYDGFIPPGRHVLSVRPTPGARWGTPTQMILDARSGETYNFTATGDHSGSLILKRG